MSIDHGSPPVFKSLFSSSIATSASDRTRVSIRNLNNYFSFKQSWFHFLIFIHSPSFLEKNERPPDELKTRLTKRHMKHTRTRSTHVHTDTLSPRATDMLDVEDTVSHTYKERTYP